MEMLAIICGFICAVLNQLAGAVDFTDSYGDWQMLINFKNSQYNAPPYQLFDTSTAATWLENSDNPTAMVFMNIGSISDWTPYRGSDGKLTFQVLWNRIKKVDGGPFEVIFKQDSAPTTHLHSVAGYEEIHSHERLTAYAKLGTSGDTVNCITQMGTMGWNQCLAPMNTWDIGSPGPIIDGSSTIAFSATTYILMPATTTVTVTSTSTVTVTSTSTNTPTTATLTTTTLTNTSTTATLTTTTLTNTSTTATLTTTTLTETSLTKTSTTVTTSTTISTTSTTTSATSTTISTTSTTTSATSTTTSTSTAASTSTVAKGTTANQTNTTNATTGKGSATSKNAASLTPAPTTEPTWSPTSEPSPAPTPKPTSAPTPAAGTTKAAEIKLSMRVAGISYAALQSNRRLKQEFKAATKNAVVDEFNTLWTEGPAISTSDVTVAIRKATASARRLAASRRLASVPRHLTETAEVIVVAVIAFPTPVDQSAVEQAVQSGASSMATAVTEEISEIPDIESVMNPGAGISTTLTAVVSTAADDLAQTGAASAPAPSEEPSTTPSAPSEEPSTTPSAPSEEHSTTAPAPVLGRNGLPCGDQAAGVCTKNATELCRYDESCSRMPPRRGGLGCNAGGVGQNCRFCGFKFFLPCDFDPSDSSLPCRAEPAAVCAGPIERCYLDRQCTSLPPALQGLGCNAGGAGQDCRFCGFGLFPPCPVLLVA